MLFTAAWRLQRRLRRLTPLTSQFAMGLMRRDDLRRARDTFWTAAAEDNADAPAEPMAWETKLYGRFIASGDRVLVVGCGGARDMVALLARGCRVEGLDVAEACLGPARRKLERYGYRAPLHAGDIATAVIPGRFDAVVFSWFCYSYLVGAAHRVSVLRRVGAQLADGGRILISYNVIPRPPRRLTAAIARMTALLSRSDWRPECGDTVTIVGHGMHRVLWHHCFVPLEIEAEARAAGLTVAFHESGREGVLVLTPVAGARGGRSW